LLFAACEKVIIDQDNNVSLISLLQDLKVDIPEGERPPAEKQGAVVALRWSALAMWLKTEQDAGERIRAARCVE
jgi:hypothetical protein